MENESLFFIRITKSFTCSLLKDCENCYLQKEIKLSIPGLDVGCRPVLLAQHLGHAADLVAGWDDETDHGRPVSPRCLELLDEPLHPPNFHVVVVAHIIAVTTRVCWC